MVLVRIDPFPSNDDLNALWAVAWPSCEKIDFGPILARSLAHLGAYDGDSLVGFINVAWDGGKHAFILDTCVHPRMRRRGIATRLVGAATDAARDRGVVWMHVDFKPDLTPLYRNCGFKPTEAGLMRLND